MSAGIYGEGIFRNGGGTNPDALVPTPVSNQIIQMLPKASVILNRARKVPMSSQTLRQPVLSLLPTAYWVGGDTGLKQTTQQQWQNVSLYAEEIATLVPIPNAYLDDAQVAVWDEVTPRVISAFGQVIDLACIWGINKPASWTSPAIVPSAIAAGNQIIGPADVGVGVTQLGVALAKDGYPIDGFASAPGFVWNLTGYRTTQGLPIYNSNVDGTPGGSLYGYPLQETLNGSWQPEVASLIAGAWNSAIVGLRQDITIEKFDQGVITDDNGKVVFNAMQQDSTIMRAVIRVGWALANPVTEVQPNAGSRSPFAVLSPIAALS